MNNEKIETYSGEIYNLISEVDPISENKEYQRISKNMKRIEQELKKTLSKSECELLDHFIDLGLESNCFLGTLNYQLGVESSRFINKIEKIGKINPRD